MVDIGGDPSYDPRNTAKPQGSVLSAYVRLLKYAWAYKVRLVFSIFFAVVVAVSFTSMLVSGGVALNVLMYEPVEAGENTQDPAEDIFESAAGLDERLPALNAEARSRAWVESMRADPMRMLKYLAGALIVLALVSAVARYLQEYLAGSIGANISVTVATEMYDNVLRLSMDFFEKYSSGELIARFTNDIFMINRGLEGVLVKVIREPIKASFFLVAALSVDPFLTMIGLCVLPPVGIALVRIGKKVKKSVRRSLERIASMATVVNETFNGILIIKGYNMEAHEAGRLRKETVKLRRYLLQMVHANAITGPITEIIMVIGVVVFLLISGQRVINGQLAGGDLVQLYGALAMMLDPVRKMSSVNNLIQTSVASAERIFEFMDMAPSVKEAPNAIDLPKLQEAVRLEDVHFTYEGRAEVLGGINLTIAKGEMVALVGFSGAGKSTIAKLLPRFYDVNQGKITFDATDIREVTFKSLRGQIGIVAQDTILFNMSVAENIAFGNPEISRDQVIAAAKAAHAHTFIEALPEGYDTMLGEGGASLSGGQRQRLAIARALVKDPAVLILDEATSSLDSESERAIQQAIDAFVVGRTTLVIAHRLSTVKKADRIVVLDEGLVAESGTHDELIQKGGLYKRLYDTQFAGDEPAA